MEEKQSLTTFECLHFLSVSSAICSTALVYAMLLDPLCVVSPFLMFYFVKQDSLYFQDRTWFRIIGISFVSYTLGLALGTLCLYTFIGGDAPSISAIIAVILLIDLIYSSIMFGRRIIRSTSSTA